jgi:hypothetical protein
LAATFGCTVLGLAPRVWGGLAGGAAVGVAMVASAAGTVSNALQTEQRIFLPGASGGIFNTRWHCVQESLIDDIGHSRLWAHGASISRRSLDGNNRQSADSNF